MMFGLDREPARWLVVDVEASGLDPARDRLLAIAAVALHRDGPRLALRPADSFEVVLAQPERPADKANILLHGIGIGAQRAGVEPAAALANFAAYVGDAPLIAFHAAFDRRLLERALHAHGSRLRVRWLDLADLAPVLQPGVPATALDDWLALHGIEVAERHRAAADAWATAELLQKLWPLARRQRADGFHGLQRLAEARHWLPR
jgi:DNA polymerase-3 subunit epsilon